jgi:Spy/CpxP family protein refolding chaperone
MGLIDLLLAPVRMPIWLLEKIRDEAEREYHNPQAIETEIRDVERLITSGEIDKRDGEQRLDALTERLVVARQFRATIRAQKYEV